MLAVGDPAASSHDFVFFLVTNDPEKEVPIGEMCEKDAAHDVILSSVE